MLKINNKILKDQNGKIIKPFTLPPITIGSRGDTFPCSVSGLTASIKFNSSIQNTIYIDFGDGSPIHSQSFIGSIELKKELHSYAVSGDYIVKIWFKIPSKINEFVQSYCQVFGEVPKELAYYNLDTLYINLSRYSGFPSSFNGGIFNYVQLANVIASNYNGLPLFLINSRIQALVLGNNFKFNIVNNLDECIKIKDLTKLSLSESNLITDVASNFKDITTLRNLSLGSNNVTITPNVAACTQLRVLAFGYVSLQNLWGVDNAVINTYGLGISSLINLTYLGFGACPNIPANLPTGIENCPNLKTLYYRSSFLTQLRADDFVTDVYNKVNTFASKITGNTLLRQVRLEICWINAAGGVSKRPTGTYQAPVGFIQGSNNGTPATPMEMLYVLVKQYKWTIYVANVLEGGIDTLIP